MVRPPWLNWCLGGVEKNGEIAERKERCVDGRSACLLDVWRTVRLLVLMSHSLMGHHDQRQESSKKLLKPIYDSWPFIVIKVEKVQRILQQPRLDRVGKCLFFLDWRHRDLLFRYHSDGTGYFLFFVEKSDIKGQHSDTLPIWNRWNWTHFVFRIKIGHNISLIGHISDTKPMGVSQSDMDTDMKSNFSDMRSDINSYRSGVAHSTNSSTIIYFLSYYFARPCLPT